MKILLVDDHPTFRDGLKFLLSSLDANLEFMDASTLDAALAFVEEQPIDLILLDLMLPGTNGLEAVRALKQAFPEPMLVILSGVEDNNVVYQSIDLGAAGYIPKASTQSVLVAALQLVLSGGVYIPAKMLGGSGTVSPFWAREMLKGLSVRQRDALRRALQGKPNKTIAREMGIAENTVKVHLSHAYQVLGVSNRTGALYLLKDADFSSDLFSVNATGRIATD